MLIRLAVTPLVVAAALALTSCGSSTDSTQPGTAGVSPVDARIAEIQDALNQWAGATDLASAQAGAEVASNLITGAAVPGYGDLDGDGEIGGATETGLLPGADGGKGLASAVESCAGPDLLGGSWAQPAERWDVLRARIDAWTPSNNTFPSLPSHPQRTVGWAALTMDAGDLAKAQEYAGHAQIHVDAARDAAAQCG